MANYDNNLVTGLVGLLYRTSGAIVATAMLWVVIGLADIRFSEPYQALIIIVALLSLIIIQGPSATIPHRRPQLSKSASSIVLSWALLVSILLLLGYVTKTSSLFSRTVVLTWAVLTPICLFVAQYALLRLVARVTHTDRASRRVVIAGVNDRAQMLAEKIESTPSLGLSIDGFFDDRGSERLGLAESAKLLGRLADLPDYVRRNRTSVIYVALPMRNIGRVTELLDELHDTTASMYYVPDVFVFDLIQCRTDSIDGMPVVALCETPFYGTNGVLKRSSDLIIASLGIIAISPLLLVIAAAVRLTTPGSTIFKQRRYGLDGREITVYKFRTMTVSEDSGEVVQATKDDDRVTKVGAVLRKYSLDELPQLINVLQGRMSIVGPRPHAVAHNEEYRKLIKGYMIRHKVNPGITGLAQIRGFRGETATVEAMRNRVESDLEYLRDWSLDLDLKIILKTVALMFFDNKAY